MNNGKSGYYINTLLNFSILNGDCNMNFDILSLFQGIATLVGQDPTFAVARIVLMLLGISFVYLGYKGILEALIMIPMGLGMATVNASVLFFPDGKTGTIFLDPLITDPSALVNILQINWLQPIYTLSFTNGLIACLVFIGIGVLCDSRLCAGTPLSAACSSRSGASWVPLPSSAGRGLRITPPGSAATASTAAPSAPWC